MPISVLVRVRSFTAPDFFENNVPFEYHSDLGLSDQSALEIRVICVLG